jgi:hypothetical protein
MDEAFLSWYRRWEKLAVYYTSYGSSVPPLAQLAQLLSRLAILARLVLAIPEKYAKTG